MYLYRIIGKTMGFTLIKRWGWVGRSNRPVPGWEERTTSQLLSDATHSHAHTHTHQYRLARQPPAPHTPTPTHAYVFAHARAHIKGVGLTYRHTCKHILVQMSLQVNMCVKTVPVQKAS